MSLLQQLDGLQHLSPDEIVQALCPPREFTKDEWRSAFPSDLGDEALVIIRCRWGFVQERDGEGMWGTSPDGNYYWAEEGEGYVPHIDEAHHWRAGLAWDRIGAGDTVILCD